MSQKKFWSILIFLVFINITNAKATTISGYVTGTTEKQLKVFYPFNDFTTVWFLLQEKSLVNLDSSNKFSVQFNIAHPTFITLYIDYNPVDLFVDDSSNLFVEIHLDSIKIGSHKNWLNVEGKYACGNLFFNEYNFYPYSKYAGITDFFEQSRNFELSYLQKSIDSLVRRELNHFDSLLQTKEIDGIFYTIVSKSIQSLLYCEVIRHPLTAFAETKQMSSSDIMTMLSWMYGKCDPLDPDLLFGTNSVFYTKYYFYVDALKKENKGLYQKLSDSVVKLKGNKLVLSSNYKHLSQIPDNRLRENAWADELFSYGTTLKVAVTVSDIEIFKSNFPESRWLTYLEAVIPAPLKTNTSAYTASEIHFVEKKQNSLHDLLVPFKGRNVLIDLWASWCIPCRQEFIYNEAIDTILKQKNVARLYISIDVPDFTQSWKSAIKQYNLRGYHLMASTLLIKDIKAAFYFNKGPIIIPRYILVDKLGRFVTIDAPRPSDPKAKELLESL